MEVENKIYQNEFDWAVVIIMIEIIKRFHDCVRDEN